MMRVVARLSRGAAGPRRARRSPDAGPAQATMHYNKMNHPKDSQQFKTNEEALAFVEECTFDYNTGQMMLEAAALHGVNVDAVLDKLDVTGSKKSGYVIRQAFRTAINDAAMNPARKAEAKSAPAPRVFDDKCDACQQEKANPSGKANKAHTCGSQQTKPRKGPVGRCVRKGGGGWEFPADTTFMPKKNVPKALNRPGSLGKSLLRQESDHFQKHHVYETTDAKGNIVYWAHKGSL